jgi:hypothetical protein
MALDDRERAARMRFSASDDIIIAVAKVIAKGSYFRLVRERPGRIHASHEWFRTPVHLIQFRLTDLY